MNNMQYKRFKERVEEIVRKRTALLRELRDSVQDEINGISNADKYAEIKAGTAVLKPLHECTFGYGAGLSGVFTFRKEQAAVLKYDAANKAYNDAVEALVKEKEHLLDVAVFAADSEAISLLQAFEKGTK